MLASTGRARPRREGGPRDRPRAVLAPTVRPVCICSGPSRGFAGGWGIGPGRVATGRSGQPGAGRPDPVGDEAARSVRSPGTVPDGAAPSRPVRWTVPRRSGTVGASADRPDDRPADQHWRGRSRENRGLTETNMGHRRPPRASARRADSAFTKRVRGGQLRSASSSTTNARLPPDRLNDRVRRCLPAHLPLPASLRGDAQQVRPVNCGRLYVRQKPPAWSASTAARTRRHQRPQGPGPRTGLRLPARLLAPHRAGSGCAHRAPDGPVPTGTTSP